jgi:excisionase family DNA binding protein
MSAPSSDASDDPILTTREAAGLLGIAVSTAQQWIENGLLPAWKTPGGHRRVRLSAVSALLRKEADAGMTGMDFETCVRCNIPIMSILFNNFGMAMEFKAMALSKEKFHSTDISGNYSEFAKALGGYSERVTDPSQVAHALVNGIAATKQGKPVLLEFITTQDKIYSTFQGGYNGGA